MPWIGGALAGAGALLGGVFSGNAAENAAETSAAAQRDAARMAAEEARFRPVGITTRFGQSQFQYDSAGRPTAAAYTVSPELRAYQDRLMALAGGGLTTAEQAQTQYAPLGGAATGLFNLGQRYLAETPEQVAQKYIQQQQDLLAPSRERQYAQLQNQLYQTGRGGLAVGATSARPSGGAGLGASNPELEAYYNALAQQDAQLAAQAQQAGQQQLAFGTGLFGTGANLLGAQYAGQVNALSPFSSYLGSAGTVEQLGQQPLDISAQLGGRSATAGANAANSLLVGGLGAARTLQAAQATSPIGAALTGLSSNPQLTSALGGWLKGAMAPSSATNYGYEYTGGYYPTATGAENYMANY